MKNYCKDPTFTTLLHYLEKHFKLKIYSPRNGRRHFSLECESTAFSANVRNVKSACLKCPASAAMQCLLCYSLIAVSSNGQLTEIF